MFLQGFDIVSHEAKLVATKMIEVIPCVNPSFVQVIKNYSDNQHKEPINKLGKKVNDIHYMHIKWK